MFLEQERQCVCLATLIIQKDKKKTRSHLVFLPLFCLLSAQLALCVMLHVTFSQSVFPAQPSLISASPVCLSVPHTHSAMSWSELRNAQRGTRCCLKAHVLCYLTPPLMSLPFTVADTILAFSAVSYSTLLDVVSNAMDACVDRRENQYRT